MPAVSLPPKENALFKRILVSPRRRAGDGERLAGSRACHSQARDGRTGGRAGTGPPRGGPRLGRAARRSALPRLAPVAPISVRAVADRGLRRPRFRARPRRPGFLAAAFSPPRAKGGAAWP